MPFAVINTQFSVNSDPRYFPSFLGLCTHAELNLMQAMALLAIQHIQLLNLDFFRLDCQIVVKLLNFRADSQEISVTNLTRSLKILS